MGMAKHSDCQIRPKSHYQLLHIACELVCPLYKEIGTKRNYRLKKIRNTYYLTFVPMNSRSYILVALVRLLNDI